MTKNSNFRHGKNLTERYCIDCGKKLNGHRAIRCNDCYHIYNRGENHSGWKKNKKKKRDYGSEWTVYLREIVRKRDKDICQLCGEEGTNVHHIDYNKKNCEINNLITLCHSCHTKTNFNRMAWFNLFVSNNYKIRKTPITIYVPGTWDMFHIGHLNILKKAKRQCDCLIVGVSTNRLVLNYKKINPIFSYNERMKIIKELRCVDNVIKQNRFFDIKQLKRLKINIIILGSDWKNKSFPELEKCLQKLSIKLKFLNYTKAISSSIIKKRIINNADAILKAQKMRKQNGA